MENFTPVSGFTGGLLIGAAASLLIVLNGRVAGVSGILGGAFTLLPGELAWRVVFLAGLILGAAGVAAWRGAPLAIDLQATGTTLVVAGFLVGVGTQMGGGCTSGHGVCGIARLSPRSLAATAVFFAVAAATVYVMRHVLGG